MPSHHGRTHCGSPRAAHDANGENSSSPSARARAGPRRTCTSRRRPTRRSRMRTRPRARTVARSSPAPAERRPRAPARPRPATAQRRAAMRRCVACPVRWRSRSRASSCSHSEMLKDKRGFLERAVGSWLCGLEWTLCSPPTSVRIVSHVPRYHRAFGCPPAFHHAGDAPVSSARASRRAGIGARACDICESAAAHPALSPLRLLSARLLARSSLHRPRPHTARGLPGPDLPFARTPTSDRPAQFSSAPASLVMRFQ
jgi:hypothetical protein